MYGQQLQALSYYYFSLVFAEDTYVYRFLVVFTKVRLLFAPFFPFVFMYTQLLRVLNSLGQDSLGTSWPIYLEPRTRRAAPWLLIPGTAFILTR